MTPFYSLAYKEVAGIVLSSDSFRSDEASDGETCGAVGLVTLHDGVTPGHWHVVNHPLVHVALMDTPMKKLQLGFMILFASFINLGAYLPAVYNIFSKFYLLSVQ